MSALSPAQWRSRAVMVERRADAVLELANAEDDRALHPACGTQLVSDYHHERATLLRALAAFDRDHAAKWFAYADEPATPALTVVAS